MDLTHPFFVLALIAGYGAVILVLGLGFVILFQMFNGTINLKKLISEKDGTGSLSRFQFLIFTFVISLSLMLLVIASIECGSYKFPVLGGEILALLGISGSSYVVSKGIQKGNNENPLNTETNPKPPGWHKSQSEANNS